MIKKKYIVTIEYGENEEPLSESEIKEGLDWIDIDAIFTVKEVVE